MSITSFREHKIISSEMSLVRDNDNEFYRIYRKRFDGKNPNLETYGVRKDYKGNDVTLDYQKELIEKLKDNVFRYSPKNDQNKTNITDAPGFGSVRLCPPYEDQNFDATFFEFCDNLCEDGDNVYDFGGGMSPFLYFLKHGNKTLVDLSNIPDVMEPLGIKYEDANAWQTARIQPMLLRNNLSVQHNSVLFCFHVLEHTNSPEELIKFFSQNFGVFVFATPQEEAIETSIYHHVFMQMNIFKTIFMKLKVPAFLRTSKNGLDIHGVVINSPKKWSYIKNNTFFNKHFKLYSEI